MGKDKLRKFAENLTFECFVQPAFEEMFRTDHPLKGNWRKDFFHNDNPIILELGCGKGEYTIALAERNPNANYIGVDIKGARMWRGAKTATERKMVNVGFLRARIEFITSLFAEGEVDEIWITVPDPQMKKATKRLTSTYFMQRYRQLLRPDGIIHLKTDSPFLYAYTQAMIMENHYPLVVDTDNLYGEVLNGNEHSAEDVSEACALQTHYEKQWLDRGLTIKYLRWQLSAEPSFVEPEIEIEKDTYRSYGRNYTSSL